MHGPLTARASARRNSPNTKLFACLVLKEFLKTDTRGVVHVPADCPSLPAAIELEWVPAFLRDELDIRSIIPPTIGRPRDKRQTGRYRRQMAQYFKRPSAPRRYGRRGQG